MKTLKELAAQYNLYTASELPAKYRNDVTDHRIAKSSPDVPTFLKMSPSIEMGVFYKGGEETHQGEKVYFVDQYCCTLIKPIDSEMLLILVGNDYSNEGKYWLMPYYDTVWFLNNISFHLRDKALRAIPEPNKIGVWTEKKLKAWIDYCAKYMEAAIGLKASVDAKNLEHEKTISDFIASIPNAKVTKHDGSTWVKTPLFEVTFKHNKKENFLSHTIEFEGTLADVSRLSKIIS